MSVWTLAGHRLEPGEKKCVSLHFDDSCCDIPATLIYGEWKGGTARPDMTLLVTAGVHPNEYPGIAAVKCMAHLDPRRLRGRLLLIHCVNPSGFWARSRVVPEDGFNLNDGYPGKPDGTPGERCATFFVQQIFPQADFIVDLHSGSPMEPLTSCLFFPAGAGEKVRKASLDAAMATDIPYLIASHAESGEYSYAAKAMGIPGLLLERGHSGLCHQQWVEDYINDLARLLRHFGMYELLPDAAPVCAKIIYERTVYQKSEYRGLWCPAVREGQTVRKGGLLGRISDFWGKRIGEYHAQGDGLVFYYNAGLAVNPGDPLVAYGLKDSMTKL